MSATEVRGPHGPFVVAALVCDRVRVRPQDRCADFVGMRELFELPGAGPLLLSGTLVLRFARGLADSFELQVRIIGPNGPFGDTLTTRVEFRPGAVTAGHNMGLDRLSLAEPGTNLFEIRADNLVLTIVPFVVFPYGFFVSGRPS